MRLSTALKITIVFGALGLMVPIGLAALPIFLPGAVRNTDIVIDDLSLTDSRNDVGAQTIDVKVRNKGDRVAFLTKAQFELTEARFLPFCYPPSRVDATYTYDVRMPPRLVEDTVTVSRDVSQTVAGNGVDRFRFKLGTTGREIGQMLYYGRLRLVYNDGDSVESEPFIALVPRPSSAVGWAVPPDGLGDPEFRRCLERKARDVEEILRRPGLRSKSTRAYAGFPNELRNEVQAFDAREKRDQERWTREFAVRGARPREIKLEGSPLGLVVDGATAWVSTGSTNKVARIDLKRATVTSLINLAWPVPVALTGNALWVRTGDPGGGHERIVRVDRDSNRVQPARPPLALRDRFAARPESFPYVATRRRLTRFDRKGEKVLRSAQLPHGSSALNIYRSVATGSGAVWVSDGNGMIRFDPTTLRAEHRIELGFAPSSITAGESLVWARGSRFVGKGRIEPASRLYRVQGVNEKLVRTSALKSACCVVFRRGLAWFVRPYLKGAEVTAVDAYGRTTRSMLVPTPKPSDVALTSDGIAVTGEGVVSLLTITSP